MAAPLRADRKAAGGPEPATAPAAAAARPAPRQADKAGTPLTFKLTGRDLEILRAVHRYRYLRTGQVKRLLFSESTTLQSARRRLRKLSANRYLVRIGRAARPEKASRKRPSPSARPAQGSF